MPSFNISASFQLPKKQFRYASEFTTRAELEALALDLDSLRLQSLIICERILGTQHKVGWSSIRFDVMFYFKYIFNFYIF